MKSRIQLITLATGFLAVASPSTMSAATLYTNIPTTYLGGPNLFSDGVSAQLAAANFVLSPGATEVNGATWVGKNFDDGPENGDFILSIHSGNALPDEVPLHTFIVTPTVSPYPTNNPSTTLLSATFPLVTLNANQSYWLSLAGNSQGNISWAGSNTGGTSAERNEFSTPAIWRASSGDFAFTIEGVPSPAGLPLLLAGWSCLAVTQRRR